MDDGTATSPENVEYKYWKKTKKERGDDEMDRRVRVQKTKFTMRNLFSSDLYRNEDDDDDGNYYVEDEEAEAVAAVAAYERRESKKARRKESNPWNVVDNV